MAKSKKKNKDKNNFLPALFGVLLSLVLSEVVLRVLPKDISRIDFSPRDDIRIFSPTRGYEYKPNSSRDFNGLGSPVVWHFNNFGFRDRSFSVHKPLGKVYRIAFLGDSMVMGLGVEDYESLPRQLEKKLQPKKYSASPQLYEVMNFGLWGSTASQTYLAIMKEDVVKLKPDLAVVGWFSSDSGEAGANQRDRKYIFLRSLPDWLIPFRIGEYLKNHSYFYLFLLNKYYYLIEKTKAVLPENKILIEEGWKITDQNMGEIKKIADKNGIRLLLLGIPNIVEIADPDIEIYKDRQENLAAIAEKHGIEYTDLKPYLLKYRNFKNYYIDGVDTHFNAKGNELVAGILAGVLKERGLIPAD